MPPDCIAFSGEDSLSEALAQRCVAHALPAAEFFPMRPSQGGNSAVIENLPSYAAIAGDLPILVMLDLDAAECAPSLRNTLLHQANLQEVPRRLVLSIAVREVESWVLGDRDHLSDFLVVARNMFPDEPELLDDPKRELVRLAGYSRRHKNELCPDAGSSAKVGPGYNDVLSNFVLQCWRPDVAARCCPSLQRTLRRLLEL